VISLMVRVPGVDDAPGEAAALSVEEQEQLAVLEARLVRRAAAAIPGATTPDEEHGE
jgi:hypothetical protein